MNKKVAIKLIIGIVFIAYLLWKVNFEELIKSFQYADILYILFAYATVLLGTALSTYKWMILLRAQNINEPNFSKLLSLYFVGIFFSNFLPSEVGGDIVRSYKVGEASGKQIQSLAAVIMERLTGLSAVILYSVIGIFLNWSLASELRLEYFIGGVVLIFLFFVFLILNGSVLFFIKKKLSYGLFGKFIEKLQSLYEAFCLYKNKNNNSIFLKSMVVSLIFQLYCIWLVYIFMKSIYLDTHFYQLILIVPTITLISTIPITINSIGVREGAFVFFLSSIGIPSSQALLVAFLYRFHSVIWGGVGGIIYLSSSGDNANLKNFKKENIS